MRVRVRVRACVCHVHAGELRRVPITCTAGLAHEGALPLALACAPQRRGTGAGGREGWALVAGAAWCHAPGKLARQVSNCSSPLRESPSRLHQGHRLGGGGRGPKSALLPITEQRAAGGTQTGPRDRPGHLAVLAAGPRRRAHERRGWPREEPASVCRVTTAGTSAARPPLHHGSWTTAHRWPAASGGHRGASLQK